MRKTLVLGLILGAAAFTAVEARAMPLTHPVAAAANEDVTLVRDGCGRGYRFSNRRQTCVPMDDRPIVVNPVRVLRAITGPNRNHKHHHKAPRTHVNKQH